MASKSSLSSFIKKCKTLISGNESLISDGKDFLTKSKKTLATAIDYLNELKEQFRWKEDSESFKDLKNIILKKFSHSI